MAFYHVFSMGSVGAFVTSKLLLSKVGLHVTLEVVVGAGAVGTDGTGVWFLACVSVHMSLKVSDKMTGVRAVWTLMHLPAAWILGKSCASSPDALHHLLGMFILLKVVKVP